MSIIGRLVNVSMAMSPNDFADRSFVYPKLSAYRWLVHDPICIKASNLSDLIFVQLGLAPLLHVHITYILSLCPLLQVVWSATSRIIAFVKNAKAWVKILVRQHVGKTVGHLMNIQVAIATCVLGCRPIPTGIIVSDRNPVPEPLRYLFQEPLYCGSFRHRETLPFSVKWAAWGLSDPCAARHPITAY